MDSHRQDGGFDHMTVLFLKLMDSSTEKRRSDAQSC